MTKKTKQKSDAMQGCVIPELFSSYGIELLASLFLVLTKVINVLYTIYFLLPPYKSRCRRHEKMPRRSEL